MAKYCRICKDQQVKPSPKLSKKIIVDFILTKNGIRKTVIEYVGIKGICPNCWHYTSPPELNESKRGRPRQYQHGFKAWVVFHRVSLRLPYESIELLADEQFNMDIPTSSLTNFIKEMGEYYSSTEQASLQKLLNSNFIHADETPISIRGETQYVWVFTNGENVIFRLRETREASIVHDLLTDFGGVLVSDFYPGYDSAPCIQQKCWVHLIRDLKDDLRSAPFNIEFETFVQEVRSLIVPIIKASYKYGLKKRHLSKFTKEVDKFYERVINNRYYKSDLTIKYQNRFIRYRNSLFVFLQEDGIPWHNNKVVPNVKTKNQQK